MFADESHQVTLERFDVGAVYRTERQRWLATEAPHRTPLDFLGLIVPYFIVIVAIVVYALSAPHTAAVLDMLTPGAGWIAPLFVELAIVFIAFRGKQLAIIGRKLSRTMFFLQIMAFLTSIITNFTGALVAVVSAVKLEKASGGDIIDRFGTLPVTAQAALAMVIIMAFVVPIVAEVAGHEVAELVFEGRGQDLRDIHWRKVESAVVYRAVFVELQGMGMPIPIAQSTAKQLVSGYLGKGRVNSPVNTVNLQLGTPELVNLQPRTARVSPAVKKARDYFAAHPGDRVKSPRELAPIIGVSHQTVWKVQKEEVGGDG